MKLELLDYQADAADKVARSLVRAAREHRDDPTELSAVVLAAPTGAGKTVVATAVVEASLDDDETTPGIGEATFLWVTDDPSLNRQTLHKMMAASSALQPNRLITIDSDFDEEIFEPGRVYFLNIQKLSTTANLAKPRSDHREWSLWETIANTIQKRPFGFTVIIDEAHRGMSANGARRDRDTIVSQIIGGGSTGRPAAPVVWGISATPKRFVNAMTDLGRNTRAHTIDVDDVRSSGLLKDQIVLGHTDGVEAAETTLVRHAVRRTRQYHDRWREYTTSSGDEDVLPALVVQVADKPSANDLADLVGTVLDEWPEISASNIVHVFGDHSDLQVGESKIHWCPPEDIQDRSSARVVFCKTAITTGWDCPRAEVLVSLRVAKDIDSITQVMGRMVRTPLARRVNTDESLNSVHCILPRFERAAVDAIAEKFRRGDDDLLIATHSVVTTPVTLTRNPTLSGGPSQPQTTTERSSDNAGSDPSRDIGSTDTTESFLVSPGSPNTTQSPTSSRPAGSPTSLPPIEPSTTPDSPDLFSDKCPNQELKASNGSTAIFEVIERLPSYTIPRRSYRSPISRLSTLATLLAKSYGSHTIHPAAQSEFRNQLLAAIDVYKSMLEETGELDDLLTHARTTRLFEKSIHLGTAGSSIDTSTAIALDWRGLEYLMNRARSLLPEGLANAYASRNAPTDDDVAEAFILTVALASQENLRQELDTRASQLLESWFDRFASSITHLSDADQDAFDRIKREADRPLRTSIIVPTRRTEDAIGESWPKHILSDDQGNFRVLLSDWEAHVVKTELESGCVAWYRNPSSGRHSLKIPYTTSAGVAGMSPDFIFLNEVSGKLTASIVDPHGTHLADAAAKLHGISKYSIEHADEFQRVQSVAQIDGQYRMLDHFRSDVREAIHNLSRSASTDDIFREFSVRY